MPLTGEGVGGREGAEHPSPAVQPTCGAVGGGDEVEGARHASTRHPGTGEEVLQEGRALGASRQGMESFLSLVGSHLSSLSLPLTFPCPCLCIVLPPSLCPRLSFSPIFPVSMSVFIVLPLPHPFSVHICVFLYPSALSNMCLLVIIITMKSCSFTSF